MVLGSSFFSSDSRATIGEEITGQVSAQLELGRRSAGARQELGRSSAGARTTFDLALQASNRRPSPAAHLPPTLPANGRTVLKRGCRAGRPLVGRRGSISSGGSSIWADHPDVVWTSRRPDLDEVSSHDWPSFSLSPPFMYTLFLTKSSLLRRQARLVSCSSSSVT